MSFGDLKQKTNLSGRSLTVSLLKLSDTIASNSEESYLAFVNSPEHKLKVNLKDHLKRSLLNVAVEQGHESFAKCLVDMGLEVNSREGCSITPFSLAVLHKNTATCKF